MVVLGKACLQTDLDLDLSSYARLNGRPEASFIDESLIHRVVLTSVEQVTPLHVASFFLLFPGRFALGR